MLTFFLVYLLIYVHMKKILRRFRSFATAAVLPLTMLLVISSCNDEKTAPPDPRTALFDDMKGEWIVSSATLDGQELTGYEDFILLLSETAAPFTYKYQCSNRPSLSPWKDEGSWQFGTNIGQDLVRDKHTQDELRVEYNLTGNQLTLKFQFTGDGYNNRLSSANGSWIFILNKQILFKD